MEVFYRFSVRLNHPNLSRILHDKPWILGYPHCGTPMSPHPMAPKVFRSAMAGMAMAVV